jgi:hypothetical protein
MAYSCPVCDAVEADAEHLANHLAVTASLRKGDHAAWLDEHAPGWPNHSPSELATTVSEHAEERSVETNAGIHEHHEETSTHGLGVERRDDPVPQRDAETARILREARELTERGADDSE